jgi:hypothetical protein
MAHASNWLIEICVTVEQKEPPPFTSEAALDGVGFAGPHYCDRTLLAHLIG